MLLSIFLVTSLPSNEVRTKTRGRRYAVQCSLDLNFNHVDGIALTVGEFGPGVSIERRMTALLAIPLQQAMVVFRNDDVPDISTQL